MLIKLISIAAIYYTAASAVALKDPTTRDEDISSAVVSTKIEKLSTGEFSYLYTITNPADSKGVIENINFSLNCPYMPSKGRQNIDGNGFSRTYDYSFDGRHVPLKAEIVGMPKLDAGFMSGNTFSAFVGIHPGQTRQLVLRSPNKPGYVQFSLIPGDHHESEYDYSGFGSHEPISPRAPWYPDWKVSGLVKGPACPENAATPLTKPVFDGQNMPDEAPEINGLLRYELKSNRNRWHEPASTNSVKLKIYYDYQSDLESFKATLNGVDISSRFHPEHNFSFEEVEIPLESTRTLIELSICHQDSSKENFEYIDEPCDIDPFEIRRTLPVSK